jgi:hypothetical protein
MSRITLPRGERDGRCRIDGSDGEFTLIGTPYGERFGFCRDGSDEWDFRTVKGAAVGRSGRVTYTLGKSKTEAVGKSRKHEDRLSPAARAEVDAMVDRIIRLADSRGHSQDSLERAVELAQGRLTKWKKGPNASGEPSARQIASIARELATSVDYLITGTSAPPPEYRMVWQLVDNR